MTIQRLTSRTRIWIVLLWFSTACLPHCGAVEPLPWNMRETATTPDGTLTMLDKPWWARAKALGEGESFTLDLNHDGRPDTLITRKDGNIIEAIDDSGHAAQIWNQISTTYVVSYHGTGAADRMVSYIDNTGRGRANEMDIRYYKDGHLRYAWVGESFDGNASDIFALTNWQYAGDFKDSKFRGSTQIFLNKYDPSSGSWVPLSECPFSFWDTDHDGRTDVVLRVSAAPLASLKGPDADYANNYAYMWAPAAVPLDQMGALNMRLSFNIDQRPRTDPLNMWHFNFGFTSVGSQPYRYAGMVDMNPLRRAPQKMIRMNWHQGWSAGVHYPATQTSFSWDEARSVWRWEGQFWIYERVFLSNTGGPTQRWNMRREYSAKASDERRIYYSEADKRYHLYGADQGWLETGQLVSDGKDLEFRWYDQDGDGYLDTIEVYRPGSLAPVRVSHFDPQAHRVPLSLADLTRQYNQSILPEAIEADKRFIASLESVASDPVAREYQSLADKADAPERRRYCLDIARELDFLKVQDTVLLRQARLPYPDGKPDPQKRRSQEPGSAQAGYSMGDSIGYWEVAVLLHRFSDQYANGRLDEAAKTLEAIRSAEVLKE